jgi:tetratricopeptide (TPR) repeat protein
MRPETKRRCFFVFGYVVCGGAAILASATQEFAQTNDPGRMTSASPRPGPWVKTDPLAANERQPDPPTPAAKAVPIGDTISVGSMQVPAGALKEFRRSEKCVSSGDYPGAVQHLQKALKIDPKFVEAHNNLGAGFLEIERYRDAIAEFEAAIAIDSKLEAPYRNKSLSLFQLKRYPEAETAARQALSLDPTRKANWYLLGSAMAAEGSRSQEAEHLLRDSMGEFPEARLALAQLFLNRCANLDAAQELRTYLASGTVEPDRRRGLEMWLERSSKGQVMAVCTGEKVAD